MKINERAPAISSAVGFVDDVSCQSRLRSGVMETLGSSSLAVDIVDAMSSFVGVRILPSAPPRTDAAEVGGEDGGVLLYIYEDTASAGGQWISTESNYRGVNGH